MENRDLERAAQVFDFVQLWMADAERGRARSLSEYLQRFPDAEAAVAEEWLRLAGILETDDSASDTRSASGSSLRGRPRGATDTRQLGPYELLREVARGGQGVVHLAMDTVLGRHVAIKLVDSPLGPPSRDRIQRLRREVEILSRLEHPNIASVYDADLDADTPYVAMRFVEGCTLRRAIRRRRAEFGVNLAHADDATDLVEASSGSRTSGDSTSDSRTATRSRSGSRSSVPQTDLDVDVPCGPRDGAELRDMLRLFEQVARALHVAHEEGVVHRDVKPANIMIEGDRTPVVLDFGLARQDDLEATSLTGSEQRFGTPAYMSPEQLRDTSGSIDRRSDVFTLAVTIYEALTLYRPFDAEGRSALEHAIVTGTPRDPCELNPALPGDVRVVLETALEKDPALRYASCLELAEDLRRIRVFEPIHARPPGPWTSFRRWTQRNPALAVSLLSAGTILSLALVITLTLLDQRSTLVEQQDALIHQLDENVRLLHSRALAGESMALSQDHPSLALLLAIEAAELARHDATYDALIGALAQDKLEHSTGESDAPPYNLALAPDGEHFVTCHQDGALRLWRTDTVEVVRELPGHDVQVMWVAFTPDGRSVLSSAEDGSARICGIDGTPGPVLVGHDASVRRIMPSPDGTRIATGSDDGTAALWDARTGERLASMDQHSGRVTGVEFSPDGALLVSWSRMSLGDRPPDHMLRVWDGHTGALRGVLAGHSRAVSHATFSADGRWLASSAYDGTVRLWDMSGSRPPAVATHVLEHGPKRCFRATFSPDGTRLLVCGEPLGQTVGAHLWSVPDGELLLRYDGHGEQQVGSGAFSPDGRLCVTGSFDATAHVWDARTGERLHVLRGRNRRIVQLAWTPDGRRVVSLASGSAAYVWRTGPHPALTPLPGHVGGASCLAFGADGTLATGAGDGRVRLWNRAGERVGEGPRHAAPVRAVAWLDDQHLVSVGDDGVCLLGTRDGKELARHATVDALTSLLVSPDGSRLAIQGPGTAQLLTGRDLDLVADLDGHGERGTELAVCMAFSADGRRLATGGMDGSLIVRDAAGGAPRRIPTAFTGRSDERHELTALSFCADGRGVLTGSVEAGTVRVELDDGRHTALAAGIVPSGLVSLPDGGALITPSKNGRLGRATADGVIWRDAHALPISALAVDAASGLVMSAVRNGDVKLWSMRDLAPMGTLANHGASEPLAAIAPDGATLATADAGGLVRLWPADPLDVARQSVSRTFTSAERSRYLPDVLIDDED